MKGSEKQIKWANDMIAKMIESSKEAKEKLAPYAASIDKHIAKIQATEHAATLINAHNDETYENTCPENIADWKEVLKEMRDNGTL